MVDAYHGDDGCPCMVGGGTRAMNVGKSGGVAR